MVDRLETIFWTYIVRCADGSLYTGWTKDLDKRLKAHNGQIPGGAKYTRTRRPVTLVWSQPFQSKREAQSREYWIKKMMKREKEALVHSGRQSIK